jgi:hypothetical protein
MRRPYAETGEPPPEERAEENPEERSEATGKKKLKNPLTAEAQRTQRILEVFNPGILRALCAFAVKGF